MPSIAFSSTEIHSLASRCLFNSKASLIRCCVFAFSRIETTSPGLHLKEAILNSSVGENVTIKYIRDGVEYISNEVILGIHPDD